MPLAIHFHDSITLGSIIFGVVIGLPGLIGLLYGAKWKAASDVLEETAKVAEQGRAVYKAAAERLGTERDGALQQVATLTEKVDYLEAYPFGEQVAELVAKTLDKLDGLAAQRTREAAQMLASQHEQIEERMIASFDLHEQRAQERHEAQMEVNQAMLRALSRIMGELRRPA